MKGSLKERFLLFRVRAKKDPDAFGSIYDTYARQIYRFIYFKVPSAEQAEDLTSETFLKAWQYLKEKREVPNLQALLYSIARNSVIDWYRRSVHERANVTLDELTEGGDDPSSDKLIKDTDTKIDTTLVLERLRHLKEEYREVIILKYLDELSTSEIAEIVGKSAATVRVMVHRATKALQDAIKNYEH